jgi:hypothetical protein
LPHAAGEPARPVCRRWPRSAGKTRKQAFRAGLVDELHLFLTPVLVGGGKRALPEGVNLQLVMLDERRFRGGTVFLRYRTASAGMPGIDPRRRAEGERDGNR